MDFNPELDYKADKRWRPLFKGHTPRNYFKHSQEIYHKVKPAIDAWERVKRAMRGDSG